MNIDKNFSRFRRLRRTPTIRNLIRETTFSLDDLIYPLFVVEGTGICEEVSSMPGVFRLSVDKLPVEIAELSDLGVSAVILFGIPDDKDSLASQAYANQGVVQRAIRQIKECDPRYFVITDVCLCEYTDHGHCGIVLSDGSVDNDPTLELLARTAVS
ncbi:MAG: porphobilinogen synthase, partial [Actinomycetia bacterium]|nr:porphobilinogen synthase [Actinomycetes bacterium]